jgi:outer membrane protein assembly factor BamA
LNYDLRDNILQPRKGAFFSLNVQYAGLPLSDFRYIRYLPEARFYVPVPFTNRRLIFAGKVRYGLLQNTASEGSGKREPPGFAAFFGGGANSVRAAGTQQMGPLSFTVLDNGDSKTKAQQPFVSGVPIPLGGDHLISAGTRRGRTSASRRSSTSAASTPRTVRSRAARISRSRTSNTALASASATTRRSARCESTSPIG